MTTRTLVAMTLAIAGSLASPAYAVTAISGKVDIVSADPDDFVVQLSVAGPCGSKYFQIQRKNKNFKEFVAVALTAISGRKTMVIFVVNCQADRNIASHGYVGYQ